MKELAYFIIASLGGAILALVIGIAYINYLDHKCGAEKIRMNETFSISCS